MNSLINRERIISITCLAFSAWVYYEAGKFPSSVLDAVGSTRYPRFLAIIIGIASIIHFVVSSGESKQIKGSREYKALILLMCAIFVYLFSMSRIGFIAATIPFLLILTCYFDKRDWSVKLKIAIPYSVIFTIVMYIFFGKVLGVLLPGFGAEG